MLSLIFATVLTVPQPDSKPDPTRQLARDSCVRVVRGSGVVVGVRDGWLYVLTAAHVIDGTEKPDVRLPPDKDGKVRVLANGTAVVTGRIQDLALLRVPAGDAKVTTVRLAESAQSNEEFDALSAGYGDDGEPELRAERVLAKKLLRRSEDEKWFAWECKDRPAVGRSGGALLNKDGKLIGICNGTQDGKGYYCHLQEIRSLLKEQNHAWLWQDGAENGKK